MVLHCLLAKYSVLLLLHAILSIKALEVDLNSRLMKFSNGPELEEVNVLDED